MTALLRELVERWRKLSAFNAEQAAKHGQPGWFSVYDDRRDIYGRCASELADALLALPEGRDQPQGKRTLCKSCFGEIDKDGWSVHGGRDVADRLKAATERVKAERKADVPR
jgi:hypothetical protein